MCKAISLSIVCTLLLMGCSQKPAKNDVTVLDVKFDPGLVLKWPGKCHENSQVVQLKFGVMKNYWASAGNKFEDGMLGSVDNHLARFVWSGYKANPVGGLRCVVLRSRKSNLPGFSRCYRGRPPTPVARRRTIVCLCRRCCGYCERGLRGGSCRSGAGRGIRCSSDSIAGRDRGCGPNSLKRSRTRIGNG